MRQANRMTDKIQEQMFEELSAIEHERWGDWQKYLHSQCNQGSHGCLIIPKFLVKQWERQIATLYVDLSESEKESDRDQVRRYWPLIEKLNAVVEAALLANKDYKYMNLLEETLAALDQEQE